MIGEREYAELYTEAKLRAKLEELGLREEYEEERTLHSGLKSRVFWNIEKLFEYPQWIRLKAIEEFIWEIGKLKPKHLIGICTGGFYLAEEVGGILHTNKINRGYVIQERPCVLLDDVLTTGSTLEFILGRLRTCQQDWKPDYIAVLVNRSNLNEIDGIPIISGIQADLVK